MPHQSLFSFVSPAAAMFIRGATPATNAHGQPRKKGAAETGRQSLPTDLKRRIRDVRQGPDGLVYVPTDEDNGARLRLEPAQ
jgi:glucose/arabinose dehydrogenase